jgi:hypothetical protein
MAPRFDEVAEHAARDAARLAGGEPGRLQRGPRPQRRHRGEPIGQRAPVVERSAVGGEQQTVLLEVAGGAPAIDGGARGVTPVTVDPAPMSV